MRKQMRRIVALLLMIVMSMTTLIGCAEKGNVDTETTKKEETKKENKKENKIKTLKEGTVCCDDESFKITFKSYETYHPADYEEEVMIRRWTFEIENKTDGWYPVYMLDARVDSTLYPSRELNEGNLMPTNTQEYYIEMNQEIEFEEFVFSFGFEHGEYGDPQYMRRRIVVSSNGEQEPKLSDYEMQEGDMVLLDEYDVKFIFCGYEDGDMKFYAVNKSDRDIIIHFNDNPWDGGNFEVSEDALYVEKNSELHGVLDYYSHEDLMWFDLVDGKTQELIKEYEMTTLPPS